MRIWLIYGGPPEPDDDVGPPRDDESKTSTADGVKCHFD